MFWTDENSDHPHVVCFWATVNGGNGNGNGNGNGKGKGRHNYKLQSSRGEVSLSVVTRTRLYSRLHYSCHTVRE